MEPFTFVRRPNHKDTIAGSLAVREVTMRYLLTTLTCAISTLLLAQPSGIRNGRPVREARQITVIVSAKPVKDAFVAGEPIAVEVTVTNNTRGDVGVTGFAFEPNEWHGETSTACPEDVYRDGVVLNRLIGKPEVEPPRTISGMGGRNIKPGASQKIVLHLDKWTIVDGWKRGTYDVTLRVNRVVVDDYTIAQINADPVRVLVKGKS